MTIFNSYAIWAREQRLEEAAYWEYVDAQLEHYDEFFDCVTGVVDVGEAHGTTGITSVLRRSTTDGPLRPRRHRARAVAFHPFDDGLTRAFLYTHDTDEPAVVSASQYRAEHPPPYHPASVRFRRQRHQSRPQGPPPAAAATTMPAPWNPPATFDLDSDVSLEESQHYASAVARVDHLTSTGGVDEASTNPLMTLHAVIPGASASTVSMLVDGGSQASLLDLSAFPVEDLQRAGIRVDQVRLCLKGVTGKGPTTRVYRAHDVPVQVQGSQTKFMRTAYLIDLSHLHVQALFGRPDLRRARALEDYHGGVVSFPEGAWRSSHPTFEDDGDEVRHADLPDTITSTAAFALLDQSPDEWELVEVLLNEVLEVDPGDEPPRPKPTVEEAAAAKWAAMDADVARLLKRFPCVTTIDKVAPVEPTSVPEALHHRVRIKPGADETLRSRGHTYNMAPPELAELRKQLDYMLQHNLIQPSAENFASPAFFIRKRHGAGDATSTTKLRLICDFRQLNERCFQDATPLPTVASIFDKIGTGMRYFSSLDIISAYYTLPVHSDDQKYLAINTALGQFSFRVLPMGLRNAPASFTKFLANAVLGGIEGVAVCLDDIIICSRTRDEHLAILERVLARLQEYNLPVNLVKSLFLQRQTTILGYIVDEHGKRADPRQVKGIMALPEPTSFKELRSWLGVTGCLSDFIPKYMSLSAPLQAIKSKTSRAEWRELYTEECKTAFLRVRTALTQVPTLALPDFSKPFYLAADASKNAIGSTLLQPHPRPDGTLALVPLAYRSKILTKAQRKHPIYYLEHLAVLDGLKAFKSTLSFVSFTVLSDHAPLQYIMSQEKVSHALASSLDFLSQFSFTWRHMSGTDMQKLPPDLLSRPGHTIIAYQPGADFFDEQGNLRPASGDLFSDFETPDRYCPDTAEITSSAATVHHLIAGATALPTAVPTGLSPAEITAGHPHDPVLGPIHAALSNPATSPGHAAHRRCLLTPDGIVHQRQCGTSRTRACTPKRSVKHLLSWYHDHLYTSHPGGEKLYMRLRTSFFFPGNMLNACKAHAKRCTRCKLAKPGNARTNHPPQPSLPVTAPGQRIGMDFVSMPVAADELGNLYDNALVVIDSLTGWHFLIPCTKEIDAIGTGNLLFEHVWPMLGAPSHIVSDRDPRFTSAVHKELMRLLGSTANMSTAHHPKTDGISESAVKRVVYMARLWSDVVGSRWVKQIPAFRSVINTDPSTTRNNQPPCINLMGFTPRSPLDLVVDNLSLQDPEPRDRHQDLQVARAAAQDALHYTASINMSAPHGPAQDISVGDWTYVHRLALKTPGDHQHPPHKLSLLYNGPYRVRATTPTTVTLHLPPHSRAHPTINRDMVRKHEGEPPTAVSGDGAEAEWSVDHIISDSFRKGDTTKLWRRRYLVAWDANGASQTHEPRDSFVDPATGAINEAVVRYEQARTRKAFGTALLDTLDSSWDYLHASARGSVLPQQDGHTTYRSFSDDTLAIIAKRLQHLPHMSARALLEQNVFRLSTTTSAAQHHGGNPTVGLQLSSKLRADTVIRLPRWAP